MSTKLMLVLIFLTIGATAAGSVSSPVSCALTVSPCERHYPMNLDAMPIIQPQSESAADQCCDDEYCERESKKPR